MIELTAQDIATAVGGRLRAVAEPEQLLLRHADTDSRAMGQGSLFIARRGETTDGHHFIDQALAAGAGLVLAERETTNDDGAAHPAVIVEDTTAAMGALAAEIVRRIRAHSATTVIGITGSAGKTTVKDLLASLLSTLGPTIAPEGSYNGEVGVPLTVFRAELSTRYLVIEMGADAPGNIADLAAMVAPDIGAVLMVGSAHAGPFGGADKIAAVKAELVEAIPAQGLVVLNLDDVQVSAMASRAQAQIQWFSAEGTTQPHPNRLRGTGEVTSQTPHNVDNAQPAVLYARNSSLDQRGHPVFDMHYGDQFARLRSGLIGAHHISNLLAAGSIALHCGLELQRIAEVLHGLGAQSRWRMQRHDRTDGISIINDAYNANPESMREALRTLATLSADTQRRSVAVLGAMLELGDASITHHTRIGETVVRLNIDRTLVVGDEAYALFRGAIAEGSWGEEVAWVPTLAEAENWLQEHLRSGDLVLVKSSHGAGLGHLGENLRAMEVQA